MGRQQFGQFIRGTATLSVEQDGMMKERFAGDSVFAWDATEQRIAYYIWSSDGSHGLHEAHYDGIDLAFPIRNRKAPDTIAYRSLWRKIDNDSFEVHRQVPDGDGWKTELTVRYRRVDGK